MMTDAILAIDQGTTGTTCLVIDKDLKVLGRGYQEFQQHFPQPGWVEHRLDEIWSSTVTAAQAALKSANADIVGVGITNQRETTGLWDTQGEPIHNAIVWQDRRTAALCDALKDEHEERFRGRTGLVLDPYFSGTKVAWLLDNVEGARARAKKGELRFGTIDTWLIWKLTGGVVHATDATNAARTLMFDIHENSWDAELCDALGDIPSSLLPDVRDSSGVFGQTKGVEFLPDGVPIAGVAGDQHAALFGQACFEPGMAKCTYGTGAFALVNTGSKAIPSKHGLVTTIAWRLGGECTYAIEGSVFIAGAIVQWMRDQLGFVENSSEIEELAKTVTDSAGVVIVPALTGLGAPHWRPDARGLISGLTRGTNRGHIARAALEGIAFQVFDLLDAMRSDSGGDIEVLRVDGGAAANDLLMQFQSDILGTEIHRPKNLDTTALGAACLAGLGVGFFTSLSDVANAWTLDETYQPNLSKEGIEKAVSSWRKAVSQA